MKTKLILASLLTSNLIACAAGSSKGSLVAHEWGTFTSVQGADGVQLEWNPYVVAELPGFVYDRNRPNHEPNRLNFAVFAGKTAFMARQRMETPVIYFYSPEKKTVDVRVDFPSGLMTEWYPHATACDAERRGGNDKNGVKKTSFLEWNGVEIDPSGSNDQLPVEKGKSHYYAARETDAAILRVKAGEKWPAQSEKFLFYRGVGHFEAPLHTTMALDGKMVMLHNRGKEELRHLFVLEVTDGKTKSYRASRYDALGKDAFLRAPLDGLKETSRDEIKAALQSALEKEKLFRAEAASMVKTWEDSWFDEPGVRVLYVLGRAWTDEVLPWKISPAPQETVRVMVGRAEVITPAMEIALRGSIVDYLKGDGITRERAVAKARAIGLGRFMDAAVRRLVKKNPGQEFSKAAFE